MPEVLMFPTQPTRCVIDIVGFNNVYYFENGKEFFHTPERHDFWEMLYVDKGRIVAITDGNGRVLEQGQVIFHEPGEIHAHISDKQVSNNVFVVSFTANNRNMEFFKKKTFTLDKTSRILLSLFIKEAQNALGQLCGDFNDKNDLDFSEEQFGASQLMRCHFTELLIKLIRGGANQSDRFSTDAESRLLAKNSTAEMIIDYLENSIHTNLTLDCLYNRFFMGKSQLNAIFRSYTGKSPMQYYNDLKITEAKRLLREDNYTIGQISDTLCYSNIQNFSRAFKKTTGFSPSEYKNSIL